MKPFKRGERITVHVDRLSVGGRGVARHQGVVIFVPLAAPGDDVEVELTFVKKNFAEARLLRVVKPSEFRITPPCPVADGTCGGCNWQQVAYEEQLRQKTSLVNESVTKFSGFGNVVVSPTIASPKPLRYRNRVQFHHSGRRIGFFKRGSHDIVDIDDCPITEEALARQIPELRRELEDKKPGRLELFLDERGRVGRRSGANIDEDNSDPTDLSSPFSQVNTQQNENLIAYVMSLLPEAATAIYDLYAGSGNFTFPIAARFPDAKVTAVELNVQSVKVGQEKAGESHIRFVASDVMGFLMKEKVPTGSIVVLDPPRTGCGPEVIGALVDQKPQIIVYVSCHPVTLARDLKAAHEKGWILSSVQPFDMFPQTDHVETVAVLLPGA